MTPKNILYLPTQNEIFDFRFSSEKGGQVQIH